MIYCTDVDGVYDEKQEVIERITSDNLREFKKNIYKIKGFDVSGGMLHKIEESLKIAKKYNIKTLIFNGYKDSNLLRYFMGEKVVGTIVK